MTTITFPADTADVINQIRSAIGRDAIFYLRHESLCPTCSINPVTNNSIDPFCITCSGTGYIYVFSGAPINAHITWSSFDKLGWVPGGQYFEGDCRLQIEYTPSNVTIVDTAKYVMVDGKKLTVKDKIFRGVPTINRVVINLMED